MPAHAQRMRSLLVAEREFASCRVSTEGGWRVRGDAQAASRGCTGGAIGVHPHAVCRGEGERLQVGGRDARGAAHEKNTVHVLDAGGVPAERLVEGPSVLSRVASTVHTWAGCGAGCAGRGGGGTRWACRREVATEIREGRGVEVRT